jgi:hypothetical protein
MKIISVKEANYIEGLKMEILFNDNKKTVIDFSAFFKTHSYSQYNKYKNPNNFKKFKIENGNIVLGKNLDMIFPVYNLYNQKIN